MFSDERSGEAKALVRISRELDRPGFVGFFTFILPLILDAIFSKIAPKLFAPNTIAMLQNENIGFRDVGRRKRMDRIGQVVIIVSTFSAFGFFIKTLVNGLATALGEQSTTVMGELIVMGVVIILLKNLASYLTPGMAPADVLNKTNSKVIDSKSQEISYTQKENFVIPFGKKKK